MILIPNSAQLVLVLVLIARHPIFASAAKVDTSCRWSTMNPMENAELVIVIALLVVVPPPIA